MGRIANCQYVVNAINQRLSTNRLIVAAGTAQHIANMEYLLRSIDIANNGRTTLGAGSFATQRIVDVEAVNTCIARHLIVPDFPAQNFWIAVSNNRILRSRDGIQWGPLELAGDWRGVAFGNNTWIVAGVNRIARSTDEGASWTVTNLSGTWRNVAFGDGNWIVVGPDGAMRSTNGGQNWTRVVSAADCFGVAFGNGVWIITGPNGIRRSTNGGGSWNFIGVQSGIWRSAAFGNNIWIVVGDNGGVRSADGGNTWTPAYQPLVGRCLSVAFGNGRWVAVGLQHIMRSPANGSSWSGTTFAGLWQSVSFGLAAMGAWIIAGQNAVMRSQDGINWERPLNISGLWSGVAFGIHSRHLIGSREYTIPGNHQFEVSLGVTRLRVTLVGGGTGGGGGGIIRCLINVVPFEVMYLVVGSGGTGGTHDGATLDRGNNGANGGDTSLLPRDPPKFSLIARGGGGGLGFPAMAGGSGGGILVEGIGNIQIRANGGNGGGATGTGQGRRNQGGPSLFVSGLGVFEGGNAGWFHHSGFAIVGRGPELGGGGSGGGASFLGRFGRFSDGGDSHAVNASGYAHLAWPGERGGGGGGGGNAWTSDDEPHRIHGEAGGDGYALIEWGV